MRYNSIRPGQVWCDTEGKPIQAHGFSVFYNKQDQKYYWYGENKEKTKGGLFNKVWHWGVRCYVSDDLYNWEDKGLIIPPQPDNLESPLHTTYCMDRPHILYCEKTKKYVAWLKIMSDGQFMSIMQADSILGPYEFVHKSYKPLKMNTGDFALVADEETGKGYFIFGRPHFEVVTATLSDTFTEVTGEFSEHYKGMRAPFAREAPAYFSRNGKNYLFTSGTTGYYPNPSKVAMFENFHGEYTDLGDPHIGDKSGTSFSSQITCVLKIPGKDTYIACADRWKPDRSSEITGKLISHLMDVGMKNLKPDETPKESASLSGKEIRHFENTSKATYVWLPIEWDGDKPVIRWRDEWCLEDFI